MKELFYRLEDRDRRNTSVGERLAPERAADAEGHEKKGGGGSGSGSGGADLKGPREVCQVEARAPSILTRPSGRQVARCRHFTQVISIGREASKYQRRWLLLNLGFCFIFRDYTANERKHTVDNRGCFRDIY